MNHYLRMNRRRSLNLGNYLGIFAFIISLIACSQPEHTHTRNVFGQDNRELITKNDYPYGALGQTDTKCTATIIGARMALTAAHCVYDSTQKKVRPELKSFLPFTSDGGEPGIKFNIKHLYFGTSTPEQERGKDWAILVFDKPVTATQQKMQLQAMDFATGLPLTVNLAGFSADLNSGSGLAVHHNCQIRSLAGERLLHDCDAKAGISGGPMYIQNGSTANIVAISVSEYRRGAPDSVNRPEYSDEYANVAISAKVIASTFQALVSVDQGSETMPAISGVQSLANPNYTVDPDLPPPPVSDYKVIAKNILDAAISLGTLARNVDWLGEHRQRVELSRYAFIVNSYSHSIELSVHRFQIGSLSASATQQEIRSFVNDMDPSANQMISEFQTCGLYCSQGNEQLIPNFSKQLSTLRTLANTVVP